MEILRSRENELIVYTHTNIHNATHTHNHTEILIYISKHSKEFAACMHAYGHTYRDRQTDRQKALTE